MIGAGAGAENIAGVGTEIGQWVQGVVIALSTAQTIAHIENLVSQGNLKEDSGPLTCANCKRVIDDDVETCPYCGAVPGEEDPQDSIDDEAEQDSEVPVHGSIVEKEYDEAPIEIDLAERFEEVLLNSGWGENDAKHGGLILARIWEHADPLPLDQETFEENLKDVKKPYKKKLLKTETIILDAFKELYEEKEDDPSPVQCEIHIYQDTSEKWTFRVDDPLNDIVISNPFGSVAFNEFQMSAKKFVGLLEERKERFKRLAEKLIEFRAGFFEAADREEAKEILKIKALYQKTMAKEAEIHPSTLSRWCSKGAVWISTPHGTFPLSAFFKRASKTVPDHDLTREAVKKIVKLVKKLNPGRNQTEAILAYLKDEHDVIMTDKTLREYLKTDSKKPSS